MAPGHIAWLVGDPRIAALFAHHRLTFQKGWRCWRPHTDNSLGRRPKGLTARPKSGFVVVGQAMSAYAKTEAEQAAAVEPIAVPAVGGPTLWTDALTPATVLALQRTAGNRLVTGAITSARLMSKRRRAEERAPEEEQIRPAMVPLSDEMLMRAGTGPAILPDLTMTEPGDAVEREAEHVAAHGGPISQSAGGGGGMLPPGVVQVLGTSGQALDNGTKATMQQRFGRDFSGVRVHTGSTAARSAEQVDAAAYTVGSDVVFGAGRYAPGTEAGDHLLAHELTHVVQGGGRLKRFHLPHGAHQGAKWDETPKIAATYAAMLATIKSIIAASINYGTQVDVDKFVENCGGFSAIKKIGKAVGSESATVKSMLMPRYLLTRRAGLLDMRHFIQLLYISNFTASAFPGTDGNRSATRQGREHELNSESESRFGPEDTTSNAIGAYTGSRLAAYPQSDDLFATIQQMLDRCDPVDFASLSGPSKAAVLHFYGDLVSDPTPKSPGDMVPANQNESAVAPLLNIPEFAGTERSFPFVIDPDDPKTITDTDFLKGAKSVDDDDDVREFTSTQRPEVIKMLTPAEKVRMAELAFEGWVADEDIDAIEVIFKNANAAEQQLIRSAIDVSDLSSHGQRARLRLLFGT
jgi:uncharacterized protein DUF4157